MYCSHISNIWINCKDCDADGYIVDDDGNKLVCQTCEGYGEVEKLIKQLEELGVDMEVIIDIDLAIRDEVFGETNEEVLHS